MNEYADLIKGKLDTVLAVDGSDLCITHNPKDEESLRSVMIYN